MTHIPPVLDESLAERVLDAVVRHGRVSKSAGWRVDIASGGSTDRTFQVRDPSGEPCLTVRLARPGLADRLAHEQRVLRELAVETTSVPVVIVDVPVSPTRTPQSWTPRELSLIEDDELPGGWLLIHEHMSGNPESIAQVSVAARERLGECLAWVHGHRRDSYTIWPSLEPQDGTRADAFHRRIDSLRRYQSAQGRLPDATTMIDQLSREPLPSSAGWHEGDFALCHGDLSIGNVLWNRDDVALIDWEFARDGDPAEDIAYLAAEQHLSSELIADIAEAYVEADGDPWAFARLPVWLPLVTLDAALWWADYHLEAGADPNEHQDVMTRLDRARRYMQRRG